MTTYHPLGYKICDIEGCDEPPRTRGLCSKHYKRLRRQEREQGVPPQVTRGEKIHSTHLTDAHVRRIRELAAPPYPERPTYAVIGAMFGISAQSVSKIVNRHTWSHVE